MGKERIHSTSDAPIPLWTACKHVCLAQQGGECLSEGRRENQIIGAVGDGEDRFIVETAPLQRRIVVRSRGLARHLGISSQQSLPALGGGHFRLRQ